MGLLTKWLDKTMEDDTKKYEQLLRDIGFNANKVIYNVYSHTIFAVDTNNKKWCAFEDKEYYNKLEKHSKLNAEAFDFSEFLKYEIQMVDGRTWGFNTGGNAFIGATDIHKSINDMKVIITTNSKDIDKSSVVVKLAKGVVNQGTSGYNQIMSILEELQKVFEYI